MQFVLPNVFFPNEEKTLGNFVGTHCATFQNALPKETNIVGELSAGVCLGKDMLQICNAQVA